MKAAQFINPRLQQEYEETGYIHIKGLLTAMDVEKLMSLFRMHYNYDGSNSTMWNSLCDIPHDKYCLT